ncbi:hypothetical protein [Dysosmobacter sp.]|jgi:hypothetical protein|uniref:hypothetical protein n=1 Tax=Dysosmobacter sp. TaxID=2591382 RepID=UPI003D8A319F
MSALQQILIVLGILALLPAAITILWKIRLFPLALYLVSTQLFFPKWAAAHTMLCMALLIGCVLYAVAIWTVKIVRWRQSAHFSENMMMERYAQEIGLVPGQYRISHKRGSPYLEYND